MFNVRKASRMSDVVCTSVKQYFEDQTITPRNVSMGHHVFPDILDGYYVYENKNTVMKCAYETWGDISSAMDNLPSFEDSLATLSGAYDMRHPHIDLFTNKTRCLHTVGDYAFFISYAVDILRGTPLPSSATNILQYEGPDGAVITPVLPAGVQYRIHNPFQAITSAKLSGWTGVDPVELISVVKNALGTIGCTQCSDLKSMGESVVITDTLTIDKDMCKYDEIVHQLAGGLHKGDHEAILKFMKAFLASALPLTVELFHSETSQTILYVIVTNQMQVVTRTMGPLKNKPYFEIKSSDGAQTVTTGGAGFAKSVWDGDKPYLVIEEPLVSTDKKRVELVNQIGKLIETSLLPNGDDKIDALLHGTGSLSDNQVSDEQKSELASTFVRVASEEMSYVTLRPLMSQLLPKSVRDENTGQKQKTLKTTTRMAKSGMRDTSWNPSAFVSSITAIPAGIAYDVESEGLTLVPILTNLLHVSMNRIIREASLKTAIFQETGNVVLTPAGWALFKDALYPDMLGRKIAEFSGTGFEYSHHDLEAFEKFFIEERIEALGDMSHKKAIRGLIAYGKLSKVAQESMINTHEYEVYLRVFTKFAFSLATMTIVDLGRYMTSKDVHNFLSIFLFVWHLYRRLPIYLVVNLKAMFGLMASLMLKLVQDFKNLILLPPAIRKLNQAVKDNSFGTKWREVKLARRLMRIASGPRDILSKEDAFVLTGVALGVLDLADAVKAIDPTFVEYPIVTDLRNLVLGAMPTHTGLQPVENQGSPGDSPAGGQLQLNSPGSAARPPPSPAGGQLQLDSSPGSEPVEQRIVPYQGRPGAAHRVAAPAAPAASPPPPASDGGGASADGALNVPPEQAGQQQSGQKRKHAIASDGDGVSADGEPNVPPEQAGQQQSGQKRKHATPPSGERPRTRARGARLSSVLHYA